MSRQTFYENNEDCDEMIKLLEEFYNINQIQKSLNTILLRQREKMDNIVDNVENAENNSIESLQDLEIAKKYSFRYVPIIVGSFIGAALTGPAGLLLGLKTGSIATGMSGGIIGGWFGYKIQK